MYMDDLLDASKIHMKTINRIMTLSLDPLQKLLQAVYSDGVITGTRGQRAVARQLRKSGLQRATYKLLHVSRCVDRKAHVILHGLRVKAVEGTRFRALSSAIPDLGSLRPRPHAIVPSVALLLPLAREMIHGGLRLAQRK